VVTACGATFIDVIVRLDRTTQYSGTFVTNMKALQYWITRFRG
jgi:hypothetical protein